MIFSDENIMIFLMIYTVDIFVQTFIVATFVRVEYRNKNTNDNKNKHTYM